MHPRLTVVADGEEGPQADGSWQARAIFEVDETETGPRLTFRRVVLARPQDPAEARSLGAPLLVRRVYAGSV